MRVTFRQILRESLLLLLPFSLAAGLIGGGYALWLYNRTQPPPIQNQPLFTGITYTRDVRTTPRSLVLHVVAVDLEAPGIGFFVTPGVLIGRHMEFQQFEYRARTVSDFLTTFNVQLAINGDFFFPWIISVPLSYYPNDGEGAHARGLAASNGLLVTDGLVNPATFHTLYISADNRVSFDTPIGAVYNAISGNVLLVQDGIVTYSWGDRSSRTEPGPRTAVALTRDERTLLIVVVDGRQPNYSEGVNYEELAQIILEYGGWTALNLDGGGSSTLAMQGADGGAQILNMPVHNRIPGMLRPVANQLGVYARAVGE